MLNPLAWKMPNITVQDTYPARPDEMERFTPNYDASMR